MYMNYYSFEVENENGESIPVSLRLGSGGQLKLKKKYPGESTISTLLSGVDDIERFIDVMDTSLKYPGNNNTIKSGETLIDLMAVNGMLGVMAKERVLTSIGVASGILSQDEKERFDKNASKQYDGLFSGETNAEDEEDNVTVKNA